MATHLEEDRAFFLEVIEDLVREEESMERFEHMTPEERARLDAEVDQTERELKERPIKYKKMRTADYREDAARMTDAALLGFRRHTAKSICWWMVRVGRTHAVPGSTALKEDIDYLQILDTEIARRGLGRGQEET